MNQSINVWPGTPEERQARILSLLGNSQRSLSVRQITEALRGGWVAETVLAAVVAAIGELERAGRIAQDQYPGFYRLVVKSPAAVELGRRGGLKGGKARAASLSAERRSEIAKAAAAKRWGPKPGDANV